MQFREIINKAKEVRDKYAEIETKSIGRPWNILERTQGFVGDVGDLTKLVMAKKGLRIQSNVDKKLAHELSDCLWSVLIIADELGVDIEKAFLDTIEELKKRITAKSR